MRVLKDWGFDGLDLDWEYPVCWQAVCDTSQSADKENFVQWVKELHELFTPQGMLVTAAVSASVSIIDAGYDAKELAKYLDYLNIMSYDFHGSWEAFTGHNSPMYSCGGDVLNTDTAVSHWIKKGFPAYKIQMGLGIYGRSFTLENSDSNGIGAAATGGGTQGKKSHID